MIFATGCGVKGSIRTLCHSDRRRLGVARKRGRGPHLPSAIFASQNRSTIPYRSAASWCIFHRKDPFALEFFPFWQATTVATNSYRDAKMKQKIKKSTTTEPDDELPTVTLQMSGLQSHQRPRLRMRICHSLTTMEQFEVNNSTRYSGEIIFQHSCDLI
jgi:hypothetical protein